MGCDSLVLGVIPARGGSKGFPGKNLALLGGRPLVVHSIVAAKRSQLLDEFVVSTDDSMIADVARAAGASVPWLRPAELAADDTPIWPVILHAAEQWERTTRRGADAVVLLQATSPLRAPEDIDGCIARFWERDADICATVVVSHDSPYFNMVETVPDSPDLVRPCTPAMLAHSRRQAVPRVYALNGAVYVVRRSLLPGLQNQFHVKRYVVYEMPRLRSVDVDGAEDLALAELLLSHGQPPQPRAGQGADAKS